MTKHPYQTCLRMPLTLKEYMTTICDRYQINESDLMRRAIEEFITNIQQNPQSDLTSYVSLRSDSDIPRV
jgi:predicted DNA-binding protein